MENKYLILDCFVDEPTCLGVPPFVSPYPRYIYGALLDSKVEEKNISYATIDLLRETDYKIRDNFKLVFLIGGAVVPGRYLGNKIGTIAEIKKIINFNKKQKFVTNSLVNIKDYYHNLIQLKGDLELFAYQYARQDFSLKFKRLSTWARLGSGMIESHPNFPNLICEIETYRGCPRQNHCSFCSEGLRDKIEFREEEEIINEIDALITKGASRFRIGCQADIFSYKTSFKNFKNGFPQPEVRSLKNLFKALKERREVGKIKVLNIDNANPGTIHNFPQEAEIILDSITQAITPGDTLALGIESIDEKVIGSNNLKINQTDSLQVIKMINEIGGQRINGVPTLLPGINLLHGLRGENLKTFEQNYKWLLKIKDLGLLVKRINLRKVYPFPETEIYKDPPLIPKKIENRFEYYRDKIRQDIDLYMLKQIYPLGTVLKDSLVMEKRFDYSYAKQIASYSITSKIPFDLEMNRFYDLVVIGYQARSVLALPYPIKINSLSHKALSLLPGIGAKRASEIIIKRPFGNYKEVLFLLDQVDKIILNKIEWSD